MGKVDKDIVIAGIIAVTAIVICAQFNGINGTLSSVVIGVIALAIGVGIPKEKIIK